MDKITIDEKTDYSTIIIKNSSNYSITFENNNIIIQKKLNKTDQYISYDELMKKDLKKSQIIYVKINDEQIPDITGYISLLKYIFINNIVTYRKIIKYAYPHLDKGYPLVPNIKLSFSGYYEKTALQDIIYKISLNYQSIEIKIKLASNEEILYKFS